MATGGRREDWVTAAYQNSDPGLIEYPPASWPGEMSKVVTLDHAER